MTKRMNPLILATESGSNEIVIILLKIKTVDNFISQEKEMPVSSLIKATSCSIIVFNVLLINGLFFTSFSLNGRYSSNNAAKIFSF